MPSKSSLGLTMFSVFHPIWGTLTVLGSVATLPLKNAKPAPGPSSLDSKNSCNPRQIPNSGVPSDTLALQSLFYGVEFFNAAVKLPTPGNAMASASAKSAAVVPIVTDKPAFSNAVLRLRRFPTP